MQRLKATGSSGIEICKMERYPEYNAATPKENLVGVTPPDAPIHPTAMTKAAH